MSDKCNFDEDEYELNLNLCEPDQQQTLRSSEHKKSKDDTWLNFSDYIPLNEEEEDSAYLKHFDPLQNDQDNRKIKILNPVNVSNNVNWGSNQTSTGLTPDEKSVIRIEKTDEPTIIKVDLPYSNLENNSEDQISLFATKNLNRLIQESDLPDKLKKSVQSPNTKIFKIANLQFSNTTVREFFETDKKEGNNYELFKQIFGYFEDIGICNLSEGLKKIKEFLEMTFENLNKMFIEEFKNFENDIIITENFDFGDMSEKGFSLPENYEQLESFKTIGKKRKKH